jgi:hypothetical protein
MALRALSAGGFMTIVLNNPDVYPWLRQQQTIG